MGRLRDAAKRGINVIGDGFRSLRGSPRELYVIFVLKALESYNFFSLSRALALYLTEQFGVGDVAAGTVYGAWGTLLVAYGFLLGGAIDWLGVRASLVGCFALNLASRAVLAAARSPRVAIATLLVPNALAGALGVPVMTIGVKRYTGEANRGFAFSLFYSIMNLAALAQALVMDFLRLGFARGFRIASLPAEAVLNSGARLFIASGCVTSAAGLALALALPSGEAPRGGGAKPRGRRLAHAASSGELELPTSPSAPLMAERTGSGLSPLAADGDGGGGLEAAPARPPPALAAAAADTLAVARAMVRSPGFWKFLAMCVFTVNLKSVFRHLDATLPKYLIRSFGCNAPIGLVYAINPAMIVALVPLVGAATTRAAHFDMIYWGSWVSAASPLLLAAGQSEWAAAAFVAVLSLGEAVWSPRFYDYSMSIAPNGREGVFTALTSAPLFAAMLPTGMLSGWLLETYCPDDGACAPGSGAAPAPPGRRLLQAGAPPPPPPEPPLPPGACDGRALWGVVAAMALTTPLLILATRRWVRPAPGDFARVDALAPRAEEAAAEPGDFNEADPLAVVDHVWHAAAAS